MVWSQLTDSDLDFVAHEVAPEFADKERLKQLIRDDPSFRKAFLSNEQVLRRFTKDDEAIVKVSPSLYFEVLLRASLKELQTATHTVERAGAQRVPIFDTKEVLGLFSSEDVLDYLASMLSSFTRVQSYTVPVRVRRGVWRKVRFNDMDIDGMTRFAEVAGEEQRLALYKRIADVCLFMLGMFPEHAQFTYRYPSSGELRPSLPGVVRRSVEDYEEQGRRFYRLAGEHPAARTSDMAEVFWLLHEKFNAAKKPLNFISDHYLHHRKGQVFGAETD